MKLAGFVLATIGLLLYSEVICKKEKVDGLLELEDGESGGQVDSNKEEI